MERESDEFYSIWRVNVRNQTFSREPVPESWMHLGGRALIARIMLDEIIPTCEPLGPNNKVIFAPGLLVGHTLSSSDRISIGGKSPLTGGIKEANAGGRTGDQLVKLGVKALILEDRPEQPGLWLLHLGAEGVNFVPADQLAGMGVYEAAPLMLGRYGDKVAIALIGPGGEMLMHSAGIQNLDKDSAPTRMAARGGLGAVMGSKGLKAVVIDGSHGKRPPLVDSQAFKQVRKEYNKALHSHPQTEVYQKYGTAAMTMMCDGFGALPTRNFSSGHYENAEAISGEIMRDVLLQRGGESDPTHACMAGCSIQCSNVYADKDGVALVSPLEYETIGLMGSNLGIADLDRIARMNYQVNDLGLDTIEVGAALGVAAEAGLMSFGDGDRALDLIAEIRQGTPLGRIIGNGAGMVGHAFGIERVPVVKNQAISAYDPRAIKGTGVTYATSPQGADHTSGLTIRAKVNHLDPKGQVEVSRPSQYKMAGYDSLGMCIFAGFGVSLAPEVLSKFIKARYGWEVGDDYLVDLGKESIRLEREFNCRAGFTAADDRLPEWLTRQPLPPHNVVFDVPGEELDHIFDELNAV
jgi:aldehyde:ferredoxin oxidoreductase